MNFKCVVCGRDISMPYTKVADYLLDAEQELFCSLACLRFYLNSRNTNSTTVQVMPAVVSKNDYTYYDRYFKMFFRSEYEAYVYSWLKFCFPDVAYETHTLVLGETKTYTPDFYIPRSNTYVEVKGRWGFGAKTKVREARKRGIRMVIIPWTMRPLFVDFRRSKGYEVS